MRPCDVLEREAGLANIEPPPPQFNWGGKTGSSLEGPELNRGGILG